MNTPLRSLPLSLLTPLHYSPSHSPTFTPLHSLPYPLPCTHSCTKQHPLLSRAVLLPLLQVAQNWRFADSPAALARRAGPGARQTQVLPAAALRDVGAALAGAQYRVFISGQRLYGFKGLAGRLGPIGVHMALLACIAGTAYSGFGGWKGSVMIPEGQSFVVGTALRPASAIATRPGASGNVLQVRLHECMQQYMRACGQAGRTAGRQAGYPVLWHTHTHTLKLTLTLTQVHTHIPSTSIA